MNGYNNSPMIDLQNYAEAEEEWKASPENLTNF